MVCCPSSCSVLLPTRNSIALFIAPPSGVVFVYILAGVKVILGLALGWAWGVIVMKAALATRPQADLLAKYAQLQSIAQNTTNVNPASGQSTFQQIQYIKVSCSILE
jgi:hypothetical protein